MGYRRLDTLLDVSKAGYWLLIKCVCGHERRTDPRKLGKLVSKRGAPSSLARLHETLKCGKCGGKDFEAVHCEPPARWSDGRPMSNEDREALKSPPRR